MAHKFTVYTADAISKIQAMKAAGRKPVDIARAIGVTRNSLAARCCQLGLNRPKRADIAA